MVVRGGVMVGRGGEVMVRFGDIFDNTYKQTDKQTDRHTDHPTKRVL